MKAHTCEPGRVVISTQGHDKGRWYAVYSVINDRDLYLVDGRLRGLDKPKKKQVKHLRALPITVTVAGKGASGGPIANSDIRKALQEARDVYESKTQFTQPSARQEKEKEECALVQK